MTIEAPPDVPYDDYEAEFESRDLSAVELVDMDRANWALRWLAKLSGEMANVEALYDAEVSRLVEWRVAEADRIAKHADFFEGLTFIYHRARLAVDKDAKTIRLPNGLLTARKKPDTYDYDEAFVEWARQHGPQALNVTVTVDKGEARKLAFADGKPVKGVPGVTVSVGEVKYKATPA